MGFVRVLARERDRGAEVQEEMQRIGVLVGALDIRHRVTVF